MKGVVMVASVVVLVVVEKEPPCLVGVAEELRHLVQVSQILG